MYVQIADEIAALVQSGQLQRGDRLRPQSPRYAP
jgi:DNA-binding GntR family transcriptional regulator